jgi:hypothetical protein
MLNNVLGTKKDVALAYKLLTSTKVGVPHTFIRAFVLGSVVGFFLVNTHNLCSQSLIQNLFFFLAKYYSIFMLPCLFEEKKFEFLTYPHVYINYKRVCTLGKFV